MTFCSKLTFYGEKLLVSRPAPQPEDHPLLVVCNCLFYTFRATVHIWMPSPPSTTSGCAVGHLCLQPDDTSCHGNKGPLRPQKSNYCKLLFGVCGELNGHVDNADARRQLNSHGQLCHCYNKEGSMPSAMGPTAKNSAMTICTF